MRSKESTINAASKLDFGRRTLLRLNSTTRKTWEPERTSSESAAYGTCLTPQIGTISNSARLLSYQTLVRRARGRIKFSFLGLRRGLLFQERLIQNIRRIRALQASLSFGAPKPQKRFQVTRQTACSPTGMHGQNVASRSSVT
jgi:hypothetical protein